MAEPLSPTQMREKVKEAFDAHPMKARDQWCVLVSRWWDIFASHVDYDKNGGRGPRPDAVETEALLADSNSDQLKPGLTENSDFTLVPLPVWNLLHGWFGSEKKIARTVITRGLTKTASVDLYPWTIWATKINATTNLPGDQQFMPFTTSSSAMVGALIMIVAPRFNTAPHKMRLFRYPNKDCRNKADFQLLSQTKISLEEAGLLDGMCVMIDVQTSQGSGWQFDSEANGDNYANSNVHWSSSGIQNSQTQAVRTGGGGGYSSSSYYSSMYANEAGKPDHKGVTGLHNLGNTCFMNSALQCLSNTQPLTEYFLRDAHHAEINRNNPLGMGGQLAEEYGHLIQELWSDKWKSVAPTKFKSVLGKFAPQFSGFQQQDSQELLAFLLDGLHEDLNRIDKKPAVENLESDGRADEIVAAEAWERHKLRNNSIIVDTFQGQFKSTVTCPVGTCGRISITFDPFMYLSLPLPTKSDRLIEIIFMPRPPHVPAKYKVRVKKEGAIVDLKRSIAEATGCNPSQLAVADLYNARIYTIHPDFKAARAIRDGDTVVTYELDHVPTEPRQATTGYQAFLSQDVDIGTNNKENDEGKGVSGIEVSVVQVIMRKEEPDTHNGGRTTHGVPVGYPLMVSCDYRTDTNATLRERIVQQVEARYCKPLDRSHLPFRLVMQTNGVCPKCEISRHCTGCELLDDNELTRLDFITRKDTIYVCWEDEGLVLLDNDKLNSPLVKNEPAALDEDEGGAINLMRCLELFTKQETLGNDDKWYCNKCKEFQCATKKFDLWNLPGILVIHLKRFQYSSVFRDKLDTMINYPITGLDLSDWAGNPNQRAGGPLIYDLFAVSLHSGGLGGGHYTAYGLNYDDKKWYYFNDSRCSGPVDENKVHSRDAYVLFYRRREA